MRIAPPNTYRKSSTKMIGWIVENTRTCGVRVIPTRLRHAIVSASLIAYDRPRGCMTAGAGIVVAVMRHLVRLGDGLGRRQESLRVRRLRRHGRSASGTRRRA